MLSVSERLPMEEVCAIVGKSRNTVHRWCTTGVYGIRLRSERHGFLRYTSRTWLEQFIAELSATRGCAPAFEARPQVAVVAAAGQGGGDL
jgi:hypothetical protein